MLLRRVVERASHEAGAIRRSVSAMVEIPSELGRSHDSRNGQTQHLLVPLIYVRRGRLLSDFHVSSDEARVSIVPRLEAQTLAEHCISGCWEAYVAPWAESDELVTLCESLLSDAHKIPTQSKLMGGRTRRRVLAALRRDAPEHAWSTEDAWNDFYAVGHVLGFFARNYILWAEVERTAQSPYLNIKYSYLEEVRIERRQGAARIGSWFRTHVPPSPYALSVQTPLASHTPSYHLLTDAPGGKYVASLAFEGQQVPMQNAGPQAGIDSTPEIGDLIEEPDGVLPSQIGAVGHLYLERKDSAGNANEKAWIRVRARFRDVPPGPLTFPAWLVLLAGIVSIGVGVNYDALADSPGNEVRLVALLLAVPTVAATFGRPHKPSSLFDRPPLLARLAIHWVGVSTTAIAVAVLLFNPQSSLEIWVPIGSGDLTTARAVVGCGVVSLLVYAVLVLRLLFVYRHYSASRFAR